MFDKWLPAVGHVLTRSFRMAFPLLPAFTIQLLGTWPWYGHLVLDLVGQGSWVLLRGRKAAWRFLTSSEIWVFGIVYHAIICAQIMVTEDSSRFDGMPFMYVSKEVHAVLASQALWIGVGYIVAVRRMPREDVDTKHRKRSARARTGPVYWTGMLALFVMATMTAFPLVIGLTVGFARQLAEHQHAVIVGTEVLFLMSSLRSLRKGVPDDEVSKVDDRMVRRPSKPPPPREVRLPRKRKRRARSR